MKNTIKKLLSVILAALMITGLAACGQDVQHENKTDLNAGEMESFKASLRLGTDEWPVIDGATACLPYYENAAAKILDISIEDARQYILCNTTTNAFKELADGEADLIFCLHGSAEQEQYAKAGGVNLHYEPFALDGFVFFVNKDNPVSSVSLSQLHDIYAGKITNWKELGGNDEAILAYQRDEGSGSQTGLYKYVIDKDELMDAPMEHRIGDMGEIIDAVSHYDNAASSIGYSYLYFVNNQHFDEEIKLLKINGAEPSADNIRSGSYPMVTEYCCIADESVYANAEGAVRKIMDWCISEEGQRLAEEMNYVALAQKGNGSIKGLGSSGRKENIPAAEKCDFVLQENNIEFEQIVYKQGDETWNTQAYFAIKGLKDETVQNAINQEIKDCFIKAASWDEYPKYRGIKLELEKWKGIEPYSSFVSASEYCNVGNILSVMIDSQLNYELQGDEYKWLYLADYDCLNFDLNTGKQIKIADVFRDGIDGIKYINDYINDKINNTNAFEEDYFWGDGWGSFKLAGEFPGISEDQKFYLTQYGETIVIILDDETPWVKLEGFAPGYISIDITGVSALAGKYIKGDIYTDESKSYVLAANRLDLDGERYLSNIDESSYMGIPNLSYLNRMSYYESMPDNMINAEKQFAEEIQPEIDAFINDYALPNADNPQFSGWITITANVNRYADYTSLTMYMYLDASLADLEYNYDTLYNAARNRVLLFKDGCDRPLSLNDIFREGYDYQTELGIDDSYGIQIFNDTLFASTDEEFLSFSYKEIGCENLKIFD